MENKHYNISVQGKVQGVFFRASTQHEAMRLGLVGFVANKPDGSVYIEVEGEQEKIDRLVDWIRLGGPPQGNVTNYECLSGEEKGFKNFDIR
jgi:acylphosphatase